VDDPSDTNNTDPARDPSSGHTQSHTQNQPTGAPIAPDATTTNGGEKSTHQSADPSESAAAVSPTHPPATEEDELDGKLEPPGPRDEKEADAPPKQNQVTGEQPQQDLCALPSTSIQDEIRTLREAMSKAIKDKVDAEGTLADRENRLKVLEGVERDFPSAKKAYDDLYPQLRRDERDLLDYIKCEKKSLAALLGPTGVDRVRSRVEDFLNNRRKLEEAVESAKQAAKEPSDPNTEVTKYGLDLAAWKKIAGTLASQHAEIRKLREETIKARQAGQYGLALWLLWKAELRRREFALGCGPKLVEPATLHHELHGAGERLAAAQQRLAEEQREAAANKAALAAAINNLDVFLGTAEATLQETLKEIESADHARLGAH
jgi:hypothetical protein